MTLRDDDERTLLERIDDLTLAIENMQEQVFRNEMNISAIDTRTKILIHDYNRQQAIIENDWTPSIHG